MSFLGGLWAVLTAAACPAAEYWVSTNGDNAWPGSRQKPFGSIQRGVQVIQPGDTLIVRAGRYEENVSVTAEESGAPGKWLTICAAPGDERKVVVGMETPRVDAYGSQSSASSLRDVQYVRLRGFYCVAPYRGRGSAIGVGKSQYIEIINCVATGGGAWSSGISLLEPKTKDNVVRNNIAVNTLPGGVGMQALLTYGGPMGRVDIDPKSIHCDHNLFFNPQHEACVVVAGNRRMLLNLAELRKAMPHWAGDTLSVDPGFVDVENLDFRLRSDSPALKAGMASPEVNRSSDSLTGRYSVRWLAT